MLLKDEQYIIKWLSQYGALTKTQIIRMLRKPPQVCDKILRNLKKESQHFRHIGRLLHRS